MDEGSTLSGPILRRILVGAAVTVLPLIFGTQIGQDPVVGIALASAFTGLVVLFLRPAWFLMAGLFFYYGALKIVDTEVFGRVAGLFRMKDLFFAVIAAYILATVILAPPRGRLLRRAGIFIPYAAFLCWLGWQYFYTVMILGEDPVLAFRAGRLFLAYLIPVFILHLMRTDRDWREMSVYLHGLAMLGIVLSVVSAVGIDYTLVGDVETLRVGYYQRGIFKFYNDVESLVYVLFAYRLWSFAHRPTPRNFLLMAVFGFGSAMFVFRARLAGLALGLVVAALYARPAVRRRALAAGLAAALALTVLLTAVGTVVSQAAGTKDLRKTYVGEIADYFGLAAEGVRTGKTDDILFRQAHINVRFPLVRQHPLCGIGFVSPFGRIAWNYHRYGLLATGYVDVGWLDALMRLGGIGTGLLVALLLVSFVRGAALARREDAPAEAHAFALTLITYLVQMFVSCYSFAYPTWEPSIVTYAILLSWTIRYAAVPAAAQEAPRQGPAARPGEENDASLRSESRRLAPRPA